MSEPSAGRVRIIGGAWRKSVLRFPARPGLRPTPDRVRETLFNWLGQDLTGLACLDLFAGSGALGFEAASRGAAQVVLVESDREAVRALQANAARLRAEMLQVVAGDAFAYLSTVLKRASGDASKGAKERFDVVFLDPPFRQNAIADVLGRLPPMLQPGARIYVESAQPVDAEGAWRELKRGRAGRVSCQLLEWSDGRSGLSRDF